MFKSVRGTKDIFAASAKTFSNIEKRAENIFSIYGYHRIQTPIIEFRDLFVRSLGKDTEIVDKQMFIVQRGRPSRSSQGKGHIERPDEVYALRPEATAGVVRAYLENNLARTQKFSKFYYTGPMFRAERPQKGRLRQFHHIGVEAIGSDSPLLDAEVVSLADRILKEIGIKDFKIKINSLGCPEDKKRLSKKLREILKDKVSSFCSDCQNRYTRNVFRILDCKDNKCKKIVSVLNIKRSDYLCKDCLVHFESVLNKLNAIGVKYDDCIYLVRGLDYYTRTVFEITHSSLGAQDALGAGGRYDTLIAQLGGEATGAIGFAFGLERLVLAGADKFEEQDEKLVYLISLGDAARDQSFTLLDKLRREGIVIDTDFENRSLKSAMRRANSLSARFVLIIGDDELVKNIVTIKDMSSGTQKQVNVDDLIGELKC